MSLIPQCRCRWTLRMFCLLSDQSPAHFILRKRWNHHLFPFGTLELSSAPGTHNTHTHTHTHTHAQNIHRILHCYSWSEMRIEKPQLFSWVTLEVMISWNLANKAIYSASLNAALAIRNSRRDYSTPDIFILNRVSFKWSLDGEQGLKPTEAGQESRRRLKTQEIQVKITTIKTSNVMDYVCLELIKMNYKPILPTESDINNPIYLKMNGCQTCSPLSSVSVPLVPIYGPFLFPLHY